MNGLWLFTQVGGIGQASVVWKNIRVYADKIAYDSRPNAAPQAAIPPTAKEKTLLETLLDLFR
ncbi:MAG: hypothetical protein H8E66_06910 [Planctomycetes bacterium]|nr:hypothetical protein [Planctomycetota bacterium]